MGREQGKEMNKIEKLKQIELNRIMEAAADEEMRLKSFYNDEMKKSWVAAINEKKLKEANEPPGN